jgi:hypothetical protein
VNDEYNDGGAHPALCAFNAIDGYLYVISQDTMSEQTVAGPNREKGLATPVQVARIWNGGPAGWHKSATVAYWRKVKAVLAASAPEVITP